MPFGFGGSFGDGDGEKGGIYEEWENCLGFYVNLEESKA